MGGLTGTGICVVLQRVARLADGAGHQLLVHGLAWLSPFPAAAGHDVWSTCFLPLSPNGGKSRWRPWEEGRETRKPQGLFVERVLLETSFGCERMRLEREECGRVAERSLLA